MAAAVTRQELEEVMATEVAKLATKTELAEAVSKLATKKDLEAFATKEYLDVKLKLWAGALREALHTSLSKEMAGHVRAFEESTQRHIAALDDKYADLPPRVTRLEAQAAKRDRRR